MAARQRPADNHAMLLGYARVSTKAQDTAAQRSALKRAGVRAIVEETRSGVAARPKLEALLTGLRAGQTLVVYRIDRLARSLHDLLRILARVKQAGAAFRSLTEPIDTSSPAGELLVQMLGAIAQFERSIILERCNSGREEARARGVRFGREAAITRSAVIELRGKGHSWQQVADQLRCHKSTAKRTAAGIRRCDGGPGEHGLRMRKREGSK